MEQERSTVGRPHYESDKLEKNVFNIQHRLSVLRRLMEDVGEKSSFIQILQKIIFASMPLKVSRKLSARCSCRYNSHVVTLLYTKCDGTV